MFGNKEKGQGQHINGASDLLLQEKDKRTQAEEEGGRQMRDNRWHGKFSVL